MKAAKNGFGVRLKKLRKNAGFTQGELADRLNKSGSAVRMWELGANEPDINTLVELSAIFDCSLDYLLCRDAVLGKEGAVRTNIPVFRLSDYSPVSEPAYYKSILPEYLDNSASYIMLFNDTDTLTGLVPRGAVVLVRMQESCLEGQTVLLKFNGEYLLRKISFCNGGMIFSGAFPEVGIIFADSDEAELEIIGVAVEYNVSL